MTEIAKRPRRRVDLVGNVVASFLQHPTHRKLQAEFLLAKAGAVPMPYSGRYALAHPGIEGEILGDEIE